MKNPKLMVIGLDAVPLEIVERCAAKGLTPTIQSMMEKGARGRALPSLPVYTPNNWAVIATGADPATNGAVDWWRELNGSAISTFDSRAFECDTIFKSAMRQGLTTLAIQYPGSHPAPDPEKNITVVPLDAGLVSKAVYPGKLLQLELSIDEIKAVLIGGPDEVQLYVGDVDNKAELLAKQAKSVGATADGVWDAPEPPPPIGELMVWTIRVRQEDGLFTEAELVEPDGTVHNATPGRWGEYYLCDIPLGTGGSVKGTFRIKIAAEPVDGKLLVARSEVYLFDAMASIPSLGDELFQKLGGFVEHSIFAKALTMKSPHFEYLLKESIIELSDQVDWIAKAAKLVQEVRGFDVFFLHWHHPDSVLHKFLTYADPSSIYYDSENGPKADRVIDETMVLCDRLLKGLLECAGPDTVVTMVSDHGNAPDHYCVNVLQRFEDVGLLTVGSDGKYDVENSLAVPAAMPFCAMVATEEYGGQVKPEEIEAVQERILDALLDWKTDDGKRVIAMALKRKDACFLNYWGGIEGDVFFHYNSGFSWRAKKGVSVATAIPFSSHGSQMPTTYTGYTSNSAFFLISGPGVKQGFRWDNEERGPFRLVDFLPTICKAAGIEAPVDAVGAPRMALFES